MLSYKVSIFIKMSRIRQHTYTHVRDKAYIENGLAGLPRRYLLWPVGGVHDPSLACRSLTSAFSFAIRRMTEVGVNVGFSGPWKGCNNCHNTTDRTGVG